MSSWFKGITEKVISVTDQVSAALQEDTFLEKLTLTTPELRAERQKIDESERHKEHVRNMLAGMKPWETRDREREILVEETREAILQLSQSKATFFGPYPMPKLDAKTEDDDNENFQDKEENDQKKETNKFDPIQPSPESLAKLQKLEPLPPLLHAFDFSAHVGLIETILVEDPELVKMQSRYSGGGDRERIFWKNYFFHCAYTRYEAGLSIDEIWGDMSEEDRMVAARTPVKGEIAENEKNHGEEETITFHQQMDESYVNDPLTKEVDAKNDSASYEMIEGGDTTANTGFPDDVPDDNRNPENKIKHSDDGTDNYELDELEAEILRELED